MNASINWKSITDKEKNEDQNNVQIQKDETKYPNDTTIIEKLKISQKEEKSTNIRELDPFLIFPSSTKNT